MSEPMDTHEVWIMALDEGISRNPLMAPGTFARGAAWLAGWLVAIDKMAEAIRQRQAPEQARPVVGWYLRARWRYGGGAVHWTGTGWTGPRSMARIYTNRDEAVREMWRQRELDWPVRLVRARRR